jgi:hypothetical protein
LTMTLDSSAPPKRNISAAATLEGCSRVLVGDRSAQISLDRVAANPEDGLQR